MLSSTGDVNEAEALDIDAWIFKPLNRRQFVRLLDEDVLGQRAGKGRRGDSAPIVQSNQRRVKQRSDRALAGLVCLVIDDNDTNVLVMSRMLRMLGCDVVVTATSGKEVCIWLIVASCCCCCFRLTSKQKL
jgi:CheY-like chemotaxis protein